MTPLSVTYTPPEGVTIGTFTADTLPASFRAPADAVISYKIYGTEAGVGVETESGEPAGYKIPLLCQSGVTENFWDGGNPLSGNGYIYNDAYFLPAGTYTIRADIASKGNDFIIALILKNSSSVNIFNQGFYNHNTRTFTINEDAAIAMLYVNEAVDECFITLFEGTTSPDHYIPHRYESNYDLFIGDSKLGEDEYLDYTTQKIYKLQEGELIPIDPPAPLPSIITYDGENTITSTETLGDVELTGEWTAIMGSTEDESIDIDFTVDADSFIAFVAVDDDPSIQVSDTITMPASASSFTLQVVSWGRERYTETVYSALS